ncbi:MAG: hypothetical protein P794_09940 [Epsilonproteobacteria bacterium (ex Lamellibrachia satsuma)]|nr:MAG: hypothetical protein P794_09940 [Epsilonproteobacteria bacterium (ex Lamellibrachia satsuma)]
MGLKLEIVITLVIIVILSAAFMVKITDNVSDEKRDAKELEFTDTTFIEVDTETMQGRAFSAYGIREQGVLTLYDLMYHTNNIELLSAKQGTYKNDRIYLDGNITLNQKKGFYYTAEHAVYDKKTKILDITSVFTGKMNKNIIHGYTMRYDTQKKEAFGKQIEAVVYTTEK